MLLRHIGYTDEAKRLDMALDICGQYERKVVVTGRPNGATGSEFADYLMDTLNDKELEAKWQSYQQQET